jgi:hypothetical protein
MAHNRDGTVVPSDSNANAIALKYLDLARSEILERQKLGYQILIAYTGAVGVIGAWMYGKLPAVPASQVPVGGVAIGQVVGSQIAASQLSIGPVPIALVVAFLAFVASWIIYDNELMITALAKYQRKAMADYFERVLPDIKLWEGSDELKAAASRRHSSLHYFFQGVVLVLPALIAVGLQRKYDFHHDCALQALEALLIFGAATVSILTLLQRRSLRQQTHDSGDEN